MLELNQIAVSFRSEKQDSLFKEKRQQILHHISFGIPEGKCLGILGESGSGKSTTGRVMCGLLKPDEGQVLLDGVDVYGSRQGRKKLQEYLSIVFQDYTTSTNPRFTVKEIIAEGLRVYQRRSKEKLNLTACVESLMEQVGLDTDLIQRYPHQLSGGQLQRVCIARALACKPKLILFDEAISSLDAHTQVQIMDLLKKLKEELGLTYVFITHDLSAITYLCDDVLFLYKGEIRAHCPVDEVSQLTDDYAKALLQAIITV